MFSKIKEKVITLYNNNGRDAGIYLLKNCGIATIFVIILLFADGEITFGSIIEWIAYLPILSLFVIIIRLGIKLFHAIFPMQPGIVKIIVDFIIFGFIMTALGYGLDKIVPKNGVWQIILALIFDATYIAAMVLLLMQKPNHPIDTTNETE